MVLRVPATANPRTRNQKQETENRELRTENCLLTTRARLLCCGSTILPPLTGPTFSIVAGSRWFLRQSRTFTRSFSPAHKMEVKNPIQEDQVKKHSIMLLALVAFVSASLLSAQTVRQFHNTVRLVDSDQLIHPLATPAGENPATIACIYNLVSTINPGCPINGTTAVPSGGSGVIVIVDAYHLPTAKSNLATFSAQFGLPPAKFHQIYATGTTPSSGCTGTGGAGNWGLEESLDIEYAHR